MQGFGRLIAAPTRTLFLKLYFCELIGNIVTSIERDVNYHMSKEIWLSEEDQIYLKSFVKNGEHKAKEIIRARVLLMLDRTGKTDHVRYNRTAEYAGISVQAVYNMRDEYLANQDIDAYLTRKKRETPPVPAKVNGKVEAEIIALACSEAPEGHSRWTLRLLAEQAVKLDIIDSISYVRVREILKKRNISLT